MTAKTIEELLSKDYVDDSPLLEIDEKWYEFLRGEGERLGREGFDEDNGEITIASNPTAYRAMQSYLTELLSELEGPEEMMIDSKEDQFDEEDRGRAGDFQQSDEIVTGTATDGDEFDDDQGEDQEELPRRNFRGNHVEFTAEEEELLSGLMNDESIEIGDWALTAEEEELLSRIMNNGVSRSLYDGDDDEMMETYNGEFEISDPPQREGHRSGRGGGDLLDHQWSPTQIKAFLQSLPRINIDTASGTFGLDDDDDLMCAICRSEFGKERGEGVGEGEGEWSKYAAIGGQVQGKGQGQEELRLLPGEEESAEYPVKMPCGHVFGLWCIEKWLLKAQPAACPLCRYMFPSPVLMAVIDEIHSNW